MLATIITFGKILKAGGSVCFSMVKTLAKFTKQKWKRDNDAVSQVLLDDEGDEDDAHLFLDRQLTPNKPSVLRRLYNNRLSLKQILTRLIVGYAVAIREVGVMFLLIYVPSQLYLLGNASSEKFIDTINIMMAALVPVETFANLFANLHGSHLVLEFAEKWYALFMTILVVVPVWTSEKIQLLPSLALAMFITGLDMIEMVGTDPTQVKHHVLTGLLRKKMVQSRTGLRTWKEKVLRWAKGVLLLPLRLLHLALPVLVNVIVVSGLLSIMIPVKWTKIRSLSNYPAYAFAALGFALRIAAIGLANYQHKRQLTRNPLYYAYLGYKALDAALYAAFQVFLFVVMQTTLVESLVDKSVLNTYYQTDMYLMLNLLAHQLVIGGITAYQAWRDIHKMFIQKIETYTVSELTVEEITADEATSMDACVHSANRPASDAKNMGFWKKVLRDIKEHINPEATLVNLAK